MKTHDFYYDLPEELIAQTPVEPRDHSRMLVVHRENGPPRAQAILRTSWTICAPATRW